METPPKPRSLSVPGFAAHSTRGILRDPRSRRVVMWILLVVAVLMAVSGSTFLRESLNPREQLGWFAVFWLACAWFTLTSFLLALLDLLLLRAQSRATRKSLREGVAAAKEK